VGVGELLADYRGLVGFGVEEFFEIDYSYLLDGHAPDVVNDPFSIGPAKGFHHLHDVMGIGGI
jgi:hypothetical protein